MSDNGQVRIDITATDNASAKVDKVSGALSGLDKSAKPTKVQQYTAAMKSLQSTAIGLAGGLAAAGAVMKTAFDLGLAGAKINQQTESFKTLLNVIGAAPDLLDQLRDASRGTISDMGLMSSTATLLAGASDELARSLADAAPEVLAIADAANKLNPTLGSTEFLYQSLMTGIKRGSPLLIDNTGLTVRLGEANEEYAKKLGKTVEQLTEEEKKQALLNGVLSAGDNLLRQVGGSADSLTDPFERLDATTKNLSDALKSKLAPGLADAATAAYDLLTLSDKLTTAFGQHITQTSKTAGSYEEYIAEVERAGRASGLHITAVNGQILKLNEVNQRLFETGSGFRILSEAEYANVNAVSSDVGAYQMLMGVLPGAGTAIQGVADATSAVTSNIANLSGELTSLGGRAIDIQNDLASATENLNDAQANFAQKTGGDIVQALKDAGVEGSNYDLAIQAVDTTMGTAFGVQEEYNKKMQEAVDIFKKTGDVEAFQSAITNLKDQFGPLNDEVMKAREKVDELKAALDAINGMRVGVLIDIQQNNGVTLPPSAPQLPVAPSPGGGGGSTGPIPQATGGPMRASQTYLMNEYSATRPETLVSGVNGAVLTKQDAQAALKGGGNKTFNFYISGSDPHQTARLVVEEIKRRA